MRVSAIIVAAGGGRRLGMDAPKAFVSLGGHPMLLYSLRTLTLVPSISEAVLALPAGYESAARALIAEAGLSVAVKLVKGGAERQDSVRTALRLVSADTSLVIIHDAARPFATADHFSRCIEAAARSGGAIVATAATDTLKSVVDGVIVATPPRDGLFQAQTPQAFRRDLISRAHVHAASEKLAATDDADLVERIGGRVEIVEGSPLNFKITTPDDLRLAEALVGASARR